jgi:hypothetical protein
MEYPQNISNAVSQTSRMSIFLSKYKYWIFGGLLLLFLILASLFVFNFSNKSVAPLNNNISYNNMNEINKKINEPVQRDPSADRPIMDNVSFGTIVVVPNNSAAPPVVFDDVMAPPIPNDSAAPPVVFDQNTNGLQGIVPPIPNDSAAPPVVFE